jgi:hypothetical protein
MSSVGLTRGVEQSLRQVLGEIVVLPDFVPAFAPEDGHGTPAWKISESPRPSLMRGISSGTPRM